MRQNRRNIISILLLSVYTGYQILFYLHLSYHHHNIQEESNYSYKTSTLLNSFKTDFNSKSNLSQLPTSIKQTQTVSRILADCDLCNLHFSQNLIIESEFTPFLNRKFELSKTVYFYNIYQFHQTYSQLRAPPQTV